MDSNREEFGSRGLRLNVEPLGGRRPMQLPNEFIVHLAGIPATGKTSFGRYLSREHGFAHYDLECFHRGWPVPSLHEMWASSPYEFARRALASHGRVAIDWGFPVGCLNMVAELKRAGARVVWFNGHIAHARLLFVHRGGIPVAAFDAQVNPDPGCWPPRRSRSNHCGRPHTRRRRPDTRGDL